MRRFTSPLDNIHIASPCPANWDEMFGSDRKRFCGSCNLNVYNLSDMTRTEAENLLINSEGRLCVKFYRRSDGTVITKNCPVGLRRLKKKLTRGATAVFALLAGFLTGIGTFQTLSAIFDLVNFERPEEVSPDKSDGITFGIYGAMTNLSEIKEQLTGKN